jgi:hypothetical protein
MVRAGNLYASTPNAVRWRDFIAQLMRRDMAFFAHFRSNLLAAIAAICLPMAITVPALGASLGGSWSGSGFIHPSSGERETVRCRVTYNRQSSKVFGVRATCASKGNRLRQTGEVLLIRPGRYVGDFYSKQFDVGGRISVTLRGSRQTVTFTGDGVRGRLSLRRR